MREKRAWLELQADRVEGVLANLNAPCRITGGTVGPRVVRFFLQPHPYTRFKMVKGLTDELGMALGARQVRVDVGEQGGIVLEFPNPDQVAFGFDTALAGKTLPPMTVFLGLQTDGVPLLANLNAPEVAHILIAGTTGCGKSTLLRSIVASLVLYNRPSAVSLLVIDPKGRTLPVDFCTRHFVQPVISTVEGMSLALGALVALMEQRDRDHVSSPSVVLIVDELADLVMTSGASHLLTRLLQRGREAGIHVVAATQRPSAAILSGLMRANFPLCIAGKVVSPEDIRIAAGRGQVGAERLQGRGDFIAVIENLIRFQAPWISVKMLWDLARNAGALGRDAVRLPMLSDALRREAERASVTAWPIDLN